MSENYKLTIMKELSIEEKAKAWDEAIEMARIAYKDEDRHLKATLERIFPELKESEDDRIRKELIEYIKDQQDSFISAPDCRDKYEEEENDRYNSWIAWLEKQGEKKSIDDLTPQKAMDIAVAKCFDECEQKPADKVEPKFKAGDTIRLKNSTAEYTIESISGGWYHGKGWGLNIIDADKSGNYELVEQKPAWSEEDELHIRELESLVKRVWAIAEHENDKDTIHEMSDLSFFLKTLKPQLKQEWSALDERNLQGIIDEIEANKNQAPDYDIETYDRFLNWLKSLRPQNRWKPSDEQMDELENEYLKSIPKY